MLRKWNVTLVVATFLLSILGTFITRSGVISSVHSFAQSAVGYWFLGFLVLSIAVAAWLVTTRLDDLKTQAELESMVSREASFLFNNLLLVGIAFSVLWGTLFPILSELVRGTKITVGPPFFNRVNVPLGLMLLALTGIGPLIAWRRASASNLRRQFTMPLATGAIVGAGLFVAGMRDGYALIAFALAGFVAGTVAQEFFRGIRARRRIHGDPLPRAVIRLVGRNRRRYGGYIVHVGILIYCVGFAGMAFKREREATLKPGESVELRSPYGHTYRFTHVGISQYQALNRIVSAATVQVARDGKAEGVMTSEKRQHFTVENGEKVPSFEPSTEVAIRSGLREDLYIVFAGPVNGTEEAVYRFTINPLVWWIWYGGLVLVLGGIITMWPGDGHPAPAARRTPATYGTALAGAGAAEPS
jgi:cytochrome c-type biogenesis protein CcmF